MADGADNVAAGRRRRRPPGLMTQAQHHPGDGAVRAALVRAGHRDRDPAAVPPAQRDRLLREGLHRRQCRRRGPAVHPYTPAGPVPGIEDLCAGAADQVGAAVPGHTAGGVVEGADAARPVQHHDRVREQVHEVRSRLRHARLPAAARPARCRAASKHTTAAVLATLSDSTVPAIGMRRVASRQPTTGSARPRDSLPSTRAAGGPDRRRCTRARRGRLAPQRRRPQRPELVEHLQGIGTGHDRDVEQHAGRGPDRLRVVQVD